MKAYKIALKTVNCSDSDLSVYLMDKLDSIPYTDKRPAMIICPGGAYAYCSVREAEPIAIRWLGLGFQAFVLNYSTPAEYPTALCQLATAVKYVRDNATEFGVDPDKIAINGFSAGGHLAADLCVEYSEGKLSDMLGCLAEDIRPNACVLSYPVISFGEFAHRGSFVNLLGSGFSDENALKLSLERRVNKEVPPTFLWSTFEDASVPVENSLLYMMALKKHGILSELHVYPHGAHGLALANDQTAGSEKQFEKDCEEWIVKAAHFVRGIFLLE